MATHIKNIKVGNETHPIEALYFIASDTLQTPEQWKTYIDSLVAKGLVIVIDTQASGKEEPATPASADTIGKLYLVNIVGQKSGTYTEFITVENPTSTYKWEKIGTTEADLSDYVKKGNYVTGDSVTGNTGEAGATTITSTSAGAQTATGSATITYDKASTVTEAAGAEIIISSAEPEVTIDFSGATFTGTAATLTAEVEGVELDDHTYTPAGSITGSQAIEAHDHGFTPSFDTVTAVVAQGEFTPATHGNDSFTANQPTKINTSKFSGGSATGTFYDKITTAGSATLTGTTSFNTDAIKEISLSAIETAKTGAPKFIEEVTLPTMTAINFTKNTLPSLTTKNFGFTASQSDIMTAPTVDSEGVLSWTMATAGTQDELNQGSQADLTGGVFTEGSKTTKYLDHGTTAAGKGDVSVSYTDPVFGTGNVSYTAPSFQTGFYTEGTSATFTQGSFNGGSLAEATRGTVTYVSGVTFNADGAHTVDFTKAGFAGTTATIEHSFTEGRSGSISIDYTPRGSISGTQVIAAHSHTVNVASHTHAIASTSTTVTGTAAVDVADHTHSVTIANHTHTIGNHTHNVNLNVAPTV